MIIVIFEETINQAHVDVFEKFIEDSIHNDYTNEKFLKEQAEWLIAQPDFMSQIPEEEHDKVTVPEVMNVLREITHDSTFIKTIQLFRSKEEKSSK